MTGRRFQKGVVWRVGGAGSQPSKKKKEAPDWGFVRGGKLDKRKKTKGWFGPFRTQNERIEESLARKQR